MPFNLKIGEGLTVRVPEPDRGMFPANLGGAVAFSFAYLIYKVLQVMGEAIGAWVGSMFTGFLAQIEPGLLETVKPVIDLLLAQPEMPTELRAFLDSLRKPAHEGGSILLAGFASQAGGAFAGTVFDALLSPVQHALALAIRPTVPSVGELHRMFWRNKIDADTLMRYSRIDGYFDTFISGYAEITRPRPGVAEVLEAERRQLIGAGDARGQLSLYGFLTGDIEMLRSLNFTPLDRGSILAGYFRELLPMGSTANLLQWSGLRPADINTFIQANKPVPGVSDLTRFALREAYRDDVAGQWGYDQDRPAQFDNDMKHLGYDPIWGVRYWRAHWELPSVSYGMEMLHRNLIDRPTFATLLRLQDYPSFWRDKLTQMSYNPLTRVDVRRMYHLKVVDRTAVKRTYLDLGYDDVNAERLTVFTELNYAPDPDDPITKYKEIVSGIVLKGYKLRILTRAQAQTKLTTLLYRAVDIVLMLAIADAETAIDLAPNYIDRYREDIRALTERSYTKRVIDEGTARTTLLGVGLTPEDVEMTLRLVRSVEVEQTTEREITMVGDSYKARTIDRNTAVGRLGGLGIPGAMQGKLLAEWDYDRAQRTKQLSPSEYEDMYYLHQITLDQFKEYMRALGYSEDSVNAKATLMTWSEMHPVAP